LLIIAPIARADGNAAALDIFAKHAAAIGYSLSDGRAKPYLLESSSTDRDTGKTTVRSHEQAGAYFRDQWSHNNRSTAAGFDGHGFWNQNENGNLYRTA
jgi:hypothetical protein